MGIHKPVLKTTLNICFQKCATHRVVSGVCGCSKSSIVAKYIFCCVLFGMLYIPWKRKPDQNRKWKWGFTFGCSLFAQFYVSTVGLEKRLQPAPLSVSSPREMSLPTAINGFTKCRMKHDRKCISLRYLIWNINKHHSPLGELHISENKHFGLF